MGLLDGVFQKVAKKIGDTAFPGVCIGLEMNNKTYNYCPPGASWGSPNPNAPTPTHEVAQEYVMEQAAKGVYITYDQLPTVVPSPPPPKPETLSINPIYSPGGTPSGEGGLGAGNPGYEFGGNPIVDFIRKGFGITAEDTQPADPEKIDDQKLLLGGLLIGVLVLLS